MSLTHTVQHTLRTVGLEIFLTHTVQHTLQTVGLEMFLAHAVQLTLQTVGLLDQHKLTLCLKSKILVKSPILILKCYSVVSVSFRTTNIHDENR